MTPARIVLFTVLLVIVGASLVKGFADSGDKNPVASVDNGAPRGILAVKLFLERRGVPVAVRRRAADAPPPEGALVLVPPPEAAGISDTEAEELVAHARAGGTVLVLCDDDEPRNKRLAALLVAGGAECFRADVPLGDVAQTSAAGLVPGFSRRLEVNGLGRARPQVSAAAFPLMRLGPDTFAVERAVGEGRIITMGSATVFTNDGLALGDNAALLLDLARTGVVVDERLHHPRSSDVMAMATARGLGPYTLALCIALLVPLSLLSLAPRRGDLPRRSREDGAPAAASQAQALAALLAWARR